MEGTDVGTEVGGNTKTPTEKHRCYMLTINNFKVGDELLLMNDKHKYCVYQVERGENGTEHIQALIYYANPRSWPKKRYPRAHIEVTKDINAGIKYCSKEETRVRGPYETGEKPVQGRRKDLETIGRQIIEGETNLSNIATENPAIYIRYVKGLTLLKAAVEKNRTEPPKVFWYWGKSGTGKTRTAFEAHKESVYIKDGTQWWDGYNNEEAIIIDDFDGKWPFRDFLRLLDRYPYQGQIKGGYVKINSPYIYITCEFEPHQVFKGENQNHINQVLRRINEVREFLDT